MNLAIRDVRRHPVRFVGTAAGLGLLLSVVIAMQGIYAGLVDDATILTRAMHAYLWIVQRESRGPFAEASRLELVPLGGEFGGSGLAAKLARLSHGRKFDNFL